MLQADEYLLPYANLVGSDPSIEDMHVVLIVQGARPEIPMRWKCDNVSIFVNILPKPKNRPKKTITIL